MAYVTIAETDAYFVEMGVATWTGSDALKLAAINRAYQFLKYLAWIVEPEEDDADDEVKEANYEAALIELTSPGSLNAQNDRGGRVTNETIEGVLSISYSDGAPSGVNGAIYPAVFRPINSLLYGSSTIPVFL